MPGHRNNQNQDVPVFRLMLTVQRQYHLFKRHPDWNKNFYFLKHENGIKWPSQSVPTNISRYQGHLAGTNIRDSIFLYKKAVEGNICWPQVKGKG